MNNGSREGNVDADADFESHSQQQLNKLLTAKKEKET
jgi:hypothetical protein